jgi:hypothetical protein
VGVSVQVSVATIPFTAFGVMVITAVVAVSAALLKTVVAPGDAIPIFA